MESENRKRKRIENENENENEEKKKNVKVSRKEQETTEEEVEEFFAILRSMQVAVRYFGEGWRTAVESDAASLVVDEENNEIEEEGDQKHEITKKEEKVSTGVLDLNSEPDPGER